MRQLSRIGAVGKRLTRAKRAKPKCYSSSALCLVNPVFSFVTGALSSPRLRNWVCMLRLSCAKNHSQHGAFICKELNISDDHRLRDTFLKGIKRRNCLSKTAIIDAICLHNQLDSSCLLHLVYLDQTNSGPSALAGNHDRISSRV